MVPQRLRRKLLLRLVGLTATGLVAVILVSEYIFQRQATRFMEESAQTITREAVHQASHLAITNDLLGMNLLLSRLVEDSNIASAQIYSIDQRLLASAGNHNLLDPNVGPNETHWPRTGQLLVRVEPVAYDNVVAGHLRIAWDLSNLRADHRAFRQRVAAIGILLLLLAGLVAHRLALTIAGHVSLAASELRALATRVGIDGSAYPGDELEQLSQLATKIRAARQPSAEPGGASTSTVATEVSVVPVIVVSRPLDLSRLSRDFEIEQINVSLRRCYELARASAHIYQAQACRIENNRIQAEFSDAAGQEEAMVRAVCFANLFMKLMDRMRAERTEKNSPHIHFHAMVHASERTRQSAPDTVRLVQFVSRLLAYVERDAVRVNTVVIEDPAVQVRATFSDRKPVPVRESQGALETWRLAELDPRSTVLVNRQVEQLLYASTTSRRSTL